MIGIYAFGGRGSGWKVVTQLPHGGLDLARRERALLVVADELAGLDGDALEGVVDERVHDRHGLRRDAGVRVDLLEHLVDVRGVRLGALLLLLLVAGSLGLLLGLLGGGLLGGRHDCVLSCWRWGE